MMRDEYIKYLKKYLSEDELEDGLKKLDEGISPQYIVGNVNFYGNNIKVNSNVLIPRFETELLVEKTIDYIKKKFLSIKDISILDIGTGSGCIAISLKKELGCRVVACDISSDALEVAIDNSKCNNTDIEFINSDIFSNINDKFDVIISNPPYISIDEKIDDMVLNNEPHLALFADDKGLAYYEKILSNINKYLNDRYIIAFEIGYLQGNDIVNIANNYLENVSIFVEKDYSGRDRFVFIISNK